MEKVSILLCVCFVFLFSMNGCASTKTVWTSTPPVEKQDNPIFSVLLQPLQDGHPFFTKLRLELVNKTNDPLSIDWNKTTYMLNDRENSVFVFKGVDPTNVKNHTVPEDVIDGNGVFSKEITPSQLLAWTPLRVSTKENILAAGMLPQGKNGIRLVIKHKGKEIIEQVSVFLDKTIEQ